MSNAIVPFTEMQQMAKAIAQSGLFGMKDEASVLALMAVAQAEGLHPATAARDFHIIQGRPALKADAMLARFQMAGGTVEWQEYTDKRVTGIFKHPNGGELAVTWTIEQANNIGLIKPGSGWQKFPRAMLRSRCVSEGIRSVFPGSVTGFYTPEEVEEFTPPAKDITPKKPDLKAVEKIIDSIDSDVVDTTDFLPLMLPAGDQYGIYANEEEWIQSYADLTSKIYSSMKLSTEDKEAKYSDLRKANDDFITKLSLPNKTKFFETVESIRKA